ncbi:Glutamate synthase [NADPH] small chain [Raoultella terrigena]|uniref:Glutamate synthase [NADPH] small chain n=1 Tax=Raoultella terrigena TaxID=577 RepID=A0A4U9D4X7_RAOTE|nr:Glutamate synthase [NADPH] small chain [Raoultella terrigena]
MAATPPRAEAERLAPALRKTHFSEIYLPLSAAHALQEAQRCLKCGEHSICEWTCPLHNHIPQWIEKVKAGDIAAAVELSHQTNCLPEITGRVCPQDRLCEGACTLHDEHGAVTIGNIERYISDPGAGGRLAAGSVAGGCQRQKGGDCRRRPGRTRLRRPAGTQRRAAGSV